MAIVPEDLHYTSEHEWVRRTDEENVVEVGITDYAQSELGDVVFVELPAVGNRYDLMQGFGTIEAVKAVSELYSPVAGEVVAVNQGLDTSPALVNTDPYGDGWMIRVRVSSPADLDQLLDAAAYNELIG
ncbi:MAG: glycine cleavage system protein GcvH [Gemmatimonas sp.]|nr:glycine cleavage system protein GcvH [Gemmatimonas sp.]